MVPEGVFKSKFCSQPSNEIIPIELIIIVNILVTEVHILGISCLDFSLLVLRIGPHGTYRIIFSI